MADEDLARELAELLVRATALEEKAAAVLEDPSVVPAAPADGSVESAAGLADRVAQLEDLVFALQNSTPDTSATGEAEGEVADLDAWLDVEGPAAEEPGEPAGYDFDDADADLPADFAVDDAGAEVEVEPAEAEAAELVADGDEAKAEGFMPCPKCSSTDADEYADGTARCADCGTPLHKRATKADDELEVKADEVEEPAGGELEVKADTVELSEMELLMARRAAL